MSAEISWPMRFSRMMWFLRSSSMSKSFCWPVAGLAMFHFLLESVWMPWEMEEGKSRGYK
jgi:hypothetical protein